MDQLKVSMICPARNKERHVGRCVETMLFQSYAPMEVVVSVQPSDDDTLGAVRDAVDRYDGPNEVRVLECQIAEYKGMAGLNQHLNWLHAQLQGDLVINCSADDYNEPLRVERTVWAWKEYDPSYIGTGVIYETPEGAEVGRTAFPGQATRLLGMDEAVSYLICSSMSSAWTRELWEKHGPLNGVEAQDMILPMMAFFERGVVYVDEPLHHHVLHAGSDNTGLEGQMRAAGDDEEKRRLEEVNAFHNTHHWASVYNRINRMGALPRVPFGVQGALVERVLNTAWNWVQKREALTMQRVQPMAMRV